MEAVIIVVLLLMLSATFSAAELAIMSAPKYKIKQLVNVSRFANLLLHLRENSSRTLITVLVSNNLINVILTIYASNVWNQILQVFAISWAIGFMLVSVVITTLILFFGEIIPKVFATKFALNYALFISPVVAVVEKILFPVVLFFDVITKFLNKSLNTNDDLVSRSDVEVFVDEWKTQWIFSLTESMIIKNLFEFNKRSVESVLRHRTEVFALSVDTTVSDAIRETLKNPYSRIPVFEHDKDHIVGMLSIRELLNTYYNWKDSEIVLSKIHLRPVFKVPVTANIFDVFLKMKRSGHHFAVVVDEHWWTEWIVTFEDILEDMVWDIKDESDFAEEKDIVKTWVDELLVRWDVPLREILMSFQIKELQIPDSIEEKISHDDMISYVILTSLKNFAKKWDVVDFGNLRFKVEQVDDEKWKIEKIKVFHDVNGAVS